ncbi:MAG: hypothetical protein Q7R56_00260 [Nanoarchaeota archaeon]|nr:hypothetical protein [Nanoarchaeota archaeon]
MTREKHYGILAIMLVALMFFLVNVDIISTGKTVYTRTEGNSDNQFSVRVQQLCAPGSVRIVDRGEYQVCGSDRLWENRVCPDGQEAVHRIDRISNVRWIACVHPSARYTR